MDSHEIDALYEPIERGRILPGLDHYDRADLVSLLTCVADDVDSGIAALASLDALLAASSFTPPVVAAARSLIR